MSSISRRIDTIISDDQTEVLAKLDDCGGIASRTIADRCFFQDLPVPLHKQCFVIFEGGGAKGITHLGALKALDDVEMARIGVAGTSAGAIVAALSAVGYSAEELFSSAKPRAGEPEPPGWNILARRGLKPIHLLGVDDWAFFARWFRTSRSKAAQDVVRLFRPIVLGLSSFVEPFWPVVLFLYCRRRVRSGPIAATWRVIGEFGFFTTEHARDILNDLIYEKVFGRENQHGELVRFRHIAPDREQRPLCVPLKIIATNFVTGALEIFDSSTPEVVVADAVAASFAIPLFFKPAKVRGRGAGLDDEACYVDGGLVSNLPVWVFSEDKRTIERSREYRNNRPIPIVAFTLNDIQPPRAASRGVIGDLAALAGFAGKVARTGIFGGQTVISRFVPHLTVVDLPTPLTVLDFDCNEMQARAAFDAGRDYGFEQLNRTFRVNPYGRRLGLVELLHKARDMSRDLREASGTDQVGHWRACLIRRLGNQSFKVVESFNMRLDADDDLVLDRGNPGAALAFRDKVVSYVDIERDAGAFLMTKYERVVLRGSLKSLIAIPIFAGAEQWDEDVPTGRSDPLGVFCIDADTLLNVEYASEKFRRELAIGSVQFAEFMKFEGETS